MLKSLDTVGVDLLQAPLQLPRPKGWIEDTIPCAVNTSKQPPPSNTTSQQPQPHTTNHQHHEQPQQQQQFSPESQAGLDYVIDSLTTAALLSPPAKISFVTSATHSQPPPRSLLDRMRSLGGLFDGPNNTNNNNNNNNNNRNNSLPSPSLLPDQITQASPLPYHSLTPSPNLMTPREPSSFSLDDMLPYPDTPLSLPSHSPCTTNTLFIPPLSSSNYHNNHNNNHNNMHSHHVMGVESMDGMSPLEEGGLSSEPWSSHSPCPSTPTTSMSDFPLVCDGSQPTSGNVSNGGGGGAGEGDLVVDNTATPSPSQKRTNTVANISESPSALEFRRTSAPLVTVLNPRFTTEEDGDENTSRNTHHRTLTFHDQHQHPSEVYAPPVPTVISSAMVSVEKRRARQKLKHKLQRYSESLQQAVEQRAMYANNCSLAGEAIIKRSAVTIRELKSAMQLSLVLAFRKMQQLRLCRVVLQREMTILCIAALKCKRTDVQMLLDDPLAVHEVEPKELFSSVAEICKLNPRIVEFGELDELLMQMHKQSEGVFKSLSLSVAKNTDAVDRSRRIRSILKNTRPEWSDSVGSYHYWDPHAQAAFNTLLRTTNYEEGRLIHHVVEKINRLHAEMTLLRLDPKAEGGGTTSQSTAQNRNAKSGPGPKVAKETNEKRLQQITEEFEDTISQVLDFLSHVCELVMRNHSVSKDVGPVLRLFMDRLFFPLVSPAIFAWSHHLTAEANYKLRENQKWLRKHSESEMGVPPQFCSSTGGCEYHVASSLLEDISFHVVPMDILNTIREASRTMFQQATKVARDPNVRIDADSFFPIMIYTCTHADVWDMHTVLHFLNAFTPSSQKVVEVGYYMTCIEGASSYITDATPESFASFNESSNEAATASPTTTDTSNTPSSYGSRVCPLARPSICLTRRGSSLAFEFDGDLTSYCDNLVPSRVNPSVTGGAVDIVDWNS